MPCAQNGWTICDEGRLEHVKTLCELYGEELMMRTDNVCNYTIIV